MSRGLLTDLELMILLVVLRLEEGAYGVAISREIESAGRTVAVAVVYATLDRLQQKGLVTSSLGDPTPERGGRAKRFFRVTAKGVRRVRDTQRALTTLWNAVPRLARGAA